jgi:hypothetical protein
VPSISIRDEQGAELFKTDLSGDRGLGKYLRSAASLRAALPSSKLFATPLAEGEAGGRMLDLALEADVPVGKDSELTIAAGAGAGIGVHPAGTEILSGSDLQAPVTVPNGTAYTSLALEGWLKAGVAGSTGQLGFGFQAGTALRYAYFHPFDTVGGTDNTGGAISKMLAAAVFPSDAQDLESLPVGAIVSLAGEGELSFSASATLSSTTNLLATPGLPLVGQVTLAQGASVTVNAQWTANGEFELRATRLSASRVRLAFYRRRGRSLTVSAKGMAGVSLDVRGRDLLATLMKAISSNPEADLLTLVNAGLDDDQIVAIQKAIEASIDRSLTLSAQLQMSALREDEALFAYDVDLAALDQASRHAIGEAMHGKLGAIGAASAIAGITLTTSAATRLRERRTSWRINVLGIFNVASFVELVKQGSVTYDPVSGALTAADRVSARRIRVATEPLQSDADKLRRVLFESLMVTAAYQAGRALGATVSLTGEHMYLEQRGRTKRHDLEDHYRALIALGLCDAAERDARLGTELEFGSSTFVIENRFDAAACDAMFFDASGQPHTAAHYEAIARQSLLALIPATDPNRAFRRSPLAVDALWSRVRELGGAIDATLSHLPTHQLAVVRGDVFTIVWWANAMRKAATELASMRKLLGQRDAAMLQADKTFLKAREHLSDALGRMVATTEARFDDPWDVLAMDTAAARLGRLESVIISNRFAARYSDAEPVPVAAPAVSVRRALRGPGEAAAEGGPRDWTAEERDVFTRHVVNLGAGKLSSGGTFSSSREQVERIFSEFIPEYAKEQRAAGRVPRVMFYAHGGLVDEREGLLPVLARRRFWALNGIYPVYFVWETGIRETLRDIRDGLIPESRATRGPLTDLAIEQAARRGRVVWSQMKKNAEAAAASGGGARLVAEAAGRLWKEMRGGIEFHALGHSAGSILHAYFLPQLVAQRPAGVPPVDVRTLHFLAPAATIPLFKTRLQKLIGPGQPITRLTMYTMTDELERADSTVEPYGKSLLYLVSRAFEDDVPTPILGMQESLKRDLQMIRFLGLAGTEKVADVVFSRTGGSAPLDTRSESVTHGGFDNDVATMTSVARRVLDVPNTTEVVEYFEESIPGFDRAAAGLPPGGVRAAARAPAAVPRRSTAGLRAAPAAGAKKWTVMVWMAGDNDLEDFGDKDLEEMKRVGSTNDVNVVVQFDSMRDDRTRRYFVTRGGTPSGDVVEELGETNTGDPAVAVDFFRWAIERYPAERLLGVIWNHGSGIDETDVYARAAARGIPVVRGMAGRVDGLERNLVRVALSGRSRRAVFATTVEQAASDRAIAYDDTSRDFLDNIELKKVLADVKRQTGRTLDVLGFDACLMNMIEVAYQVKGAAHVVVGSEELEPGEGWPYHRVLQALADDPAQTAAEIGARIVDLYIESYATGNITQSALNLSQIDGVRRAVQALATALRKSLKTPAEYAAITKALNATQRFDMHDFVDLGDFCRELATRSRSAAVKAAARATIEALAAEGGFVVAQRHKGSGVAEATGVAIYFPRGPVNKVYGRLDFAKDGGWQGFLEAYHRA